MNNLKDTYSITIDFKYVIDIADGNEKFLINLLKTIKKGLIKYPLVINQHLQNKEWKNLKATAHKFKSSVTYLGIASFDLLLDNIEKFETNGISEKKLQGLVEKMQQLSIEAHHLVNGKIDELTSGDLKEIDN